MPEIKYHPKEKITTKQWKMIRKPKLSILGLAQPLVLHKNAGGKVIVDR
ncbi:MAG: hypothetical protein N3G21_02415 [Candidatus Hydrogenedentes bacterium]|nr:hypothetical protein [Candidatus Hydrogenedentota bacterium]